MLAYCEIQLVTKPGITAPVLSSKIINVLHPLFASNPGIYGLLFPKAKEGTYPTTGDTIKVFAKTEQDATFVQKLLQMKDTRNYIITDVSNVPTFAKPAIACFKFRIPKAPTNKEDKYYYEQLQKRLECRNHAATLPYLELFSSSTGSNQKRPFRQYFYQKEVDASTGMANSFGFSTYKNVLALPNL